MSESRWQVWRPDNLLSAPERGTVVSDIPDIPIPSGPSEAVQQAELDRLRKHAEQQGLVQGRTRGAEEGKKQGYDAGFQQGREEGLAQGKADWEAQQTQQTAQFALLLDNFKAALDDLESAIPSRLVQLALTAARAVVGEQVVCDSTHTALLTRIRQLLQEDTLLQGEARLWVSPEDLSAVQEKLGTVLEARQWALQADARMLPGGCRVSPADGELDATTETRWQTLCTLSREDTSL